MQRTKEEIELLVQLGYDPNDPSYSVEFFVTATATKERSTAKMDIEKRVGQYVAIRDEIRAIEERHKEELRRRRELLEILEGTIHRFMDENKLKNLRTEAGTCYISTTWKSPLQDADAFMRFVIENEEFDLLERRASSTAVRAYVEEHNHLPSGVNLNAVTSVGVRRPNGGAKS